MLVRMQGDGSHLLESLPILSSQERSLLLSIECDRGSLSCALSIKVGILQNGAVG